MTKEQVLEKLRALVASGAPLDESVDLAIRRAAKRHFTGFGAAVRAAGGEPSGRPRKWTVATVLAGIREMVGAGRTATTSEARRWRPGLYHGARAVFGSWQAAVAAARR
jgi:hypothetical protein